MGDGPMATTHRSEDEDACKWCHGKLSIIVSRDPDEEVDCVCTDPPEDTAVTVDLVIDTSAIEAELEKLGGRHG